MRPTCALELLLALALVLVLLVWLPAVIVAGSRAGPGTLDPILNHSSERSCT